MRKYLLDSGILTAYVHRRNGVYERALELRKTGHRIGTGTPVVGEFVAGVKRSSSPERNLPKLSLALLSLKVWSFEQDAAFEYGELLSELTLLGRPMQTIDIQIAAIAMALGNCVVVTTDSDLSAVPGLAVENWAEK
jgi:tRNA(fMet)-specific endonuclease VapC